jgi:hypothetical protein
MNGETAIAFAARRFEQLHPRDTWPEWLSRCTIPCYHFDGNDNIVVTFSVTPIATNNGIRYFEVAVDHRQATRLSLVTKICCSFPVPIYRDLIRENNVSHYLIDQCRKVR